MLLTNAAVLYLNKDTFLLPVKPKSIDYSPEMLSFEVGLLFWAVFYSFFLEMRSTLRPISSCFCHV